MHYTDTFTEHERKGVEAHFGTPWEELDDTAKLMRGLVYRHTLSPEAIAKQILGTNTLTDIDPADREKARSILGGFGVNLSGDSNNAV